MGSESLSECRSGIYGANTVGWVDAGGRGGGHE